MSSSSDTIFALSTSPGRSGVAVIRVSGPASWKGAETLTRKLISPRFAQYSPLVHPQDKSVIDRALVLGFKGPKSFTGEDTIEYHLHGSRAVIDEMLGVLAALPGHRMAEPGEFTKRAFLNDKMDLTEAEAIADLIDAETSAQKAQALLQMGGALSDLYNGWTGQLTKVLAHLEADIEFPDEDLPEGIAPEITDKTRTLLAEIEVHLNDGRRGERLRDGIHVAVIGAPNAGKSSLINALAQRDVAIVSDLAGTTRDIIEVHLNLGGYPVILSDTAGLRPEQMGEAGHDAIESEGVRRALKRAVEADIRLLLFDGTEKEIHADTLDLNNDQALLVVNKVDLDSSSSCGLTAGSKSDFAQDPAIKSQDDIIFISALTGEGLDKLIEVLVEKTRTLVDFSSETPALTRQRHREALEECRACLMRSFEADLPELMAEDLRLAIRYLGKITGRVDVEDLLDVVFRDFCIGK